MGPAPLPRRERHLGRFDKGTEALIGIHLKGQSDFLGKVTGGCGKVRKSYGGRSQKAAGKMKLIVVQELFNTPTTCIADSVLLAAWGWWYPEDGPETMYGWKRSNFNIPTGYEVMAPPVATPEIKGIPCRVSKA